MSGEKSVCGISKYVSSNNKLRQQSPLFDFEANQKQVSQPFVRRRILVTRPTPANPQFTRLLFRLHNRAGLKLFFLSPPPPSLPQNALHTSDSSLSCISTSCVLWRIFEQPPRLEWSACSPLSTLSSELHWATDRQRGGGGGEVGGWRGGQDKKCKWTPQHFSMPFTTRR